MTEDIIIVNGVKMSYTEYKAMRKAKTTPVKKTRKRKVETYSDVSFTKDYVICVMNKLKPFKSLVAYQDHAYKQWGTIANLIMGLKHIKVPFAKSCREIRELHRLFDKIKNTRNKRDMVDYLYKFTWKLDDVNTSLESLLKGIDASEVKWGLMGRECIDGKGKRLGLATISYKVANAIKDIKQMNEDMIKLASVL